MPHNEAAIVAAAGLIALAVAQGIGRFAFTPILPMMQSDLGLTLKTAGWLAAANYAGYLIGALSAARLPMAGAIRGGMLLIALVTAGMGVTDSFAAWIVLRLLAGIASAWVLVHISAWALDRLRDLREPRKNGVAFAGVGVGIAGAGLLCLLLMQVGYGSDRAWELFGAAALSLTAMTWSAFRGGERRAVEPDKPKRRPRTGWDRDRIRLVLCYGAFGFGYIIPATFLPVMARHYISTPAVFGWAWPVFGAATAVSTYAVSRWLRTVDNRKLWASASFLMAIGVVLPVAWAALGAILIAALLVGGTMMVITMTGLQEAQAVAGRQATGFIAAMTAVFAVGQILGPIVVSAVTELPRGFAGALIAASIVLALAALSLWRSTHRIPAKMSRDSKRVETRN
ncbi:MAG: YbfB/YjiJ family MFS transporter [Gammaproteobacteria bacterium]